MTNWPEQYRNIVLIAILVLFLFSGVFYFFYIRPLAAEESMKIDELKRIDQDILFYQQELTKLEPKKFTEEEKLLLEGSIPARPNVEEIIKDLEKAELETKIVIESIGVSIHPNELVIGENQLPDVNGGGNETPPDTGTPVEETASDTSTAQETELVQNQDFIAWEHILPSETLETVKEKLAEIRDITVSYVELAINVNGKVEDVNTFINELEQLKRVIHIQNYDYTINEEKENRLEGIITIRGFYSEDFADFITEESDFALDYEFAPDKLNRYLEPEKLEQVKPEEGTEAIINVPSETVSGESSDNISLDAAESGSNEESKEKESAEASLPEFSPLLQYTFPDGKPNSSVAEFYVVQTGAYTSTHYLNKMVNRLLDKGIYPRVIHNKFSFVYTAANTDEATAQKYAVNLKKQGFASYVKALPFRLTKEETESLLPEANEVIKTVTEITNSGRHEKKSKSTEEQKNVFQDKIKAYQEGVALAVEQSGSESRKMELQHTLTVLGQVEYLLFNDQTNVTPESISKVETLLLDYVLSLNGYVPVNQKGQ
jgi:Tfp pilus assembly protein PilO